MNEWCERLEKEDGVVRVFGSVNPDHEIAGLEEAECHVRACFFFQAEDGIRDYKVTGVQTCALPISGIEHHVDAPGLGILIEHLLPGLTAILSAEDAALFVIGKGMSERRDKGDVRIRSEERRVGKECRSRWSRYH